MIGTFSLAVLVLAGIATAGGAIVLYLLEIEWPAWTRGVFFGVALVLGVMVGTWLYPSLEVTPPGKSNLARAIRWVAATFVTLVLAGLTKYLYG